MSVCLRKFLKRPPVDKSREPVYRGLVKLERNGWHRQLLAVPDEYGVTPLEVLPWRQARLVFRLEAAGSFVSRTSIVSSGLSRRVVVHSAA